jgi:hypothetical protein
MKELPPNKTKIVCTIGPASDSQEVMEQMLLAGIRSAFTVPSGMSRPRIRWRAESKRFSLKGTGNSMRPEREENSGAWRPEQNVKEQAQRWLPLRDNRVNL